MFTISITHSCPSGKSIRVESVVLGCTELPLLLNDTNAALPCLDSVDIHIRELIRLAAMKE